jgi:hypothetical protein
MKFGDAGRLRDRWVKWECGVMKYAKYGLGMVAVALWAVGLVDQLDSTPALAAYLGISAGMVALATL